MIIRPRPARVHSFSRLESRETFSQVSVVAPYLKRPQFARQAVPIVLGPRKSQLQSKVRARRAWFRRPKVRTSRCRNYASPCINKPSLCTHQTVLIRYKGDKNAGTAMSSFYFEMASQQGKAPTSAISVDWQHSISATRRCHTLPLFIRQKRTF